MLTSGEVVLVSYGGGTNSTALLVQMVVLGGSPPHAILMADPGGEFPRTYAYRDMFSRWLVEHGYPPITTVKKGGNGRTLEEDCLAKNVLPSIAYGYKTCSHKFKIEPQEKWANNDVTCREVWKRGERIVKLIGYDADEPWRAKIDECKKYRYCYPLIEWGMGRDECVDAIKNAGLPIPGKSSCFFCPSSTVEEIIKLGDINPDLLERALRMESNAELTSIKGLGRRFSWRDVVEADRAQLQLFPRIDIPCTCFD